MKKVFIMILFGTLSYLFALTPPPINAYGDEIGKYIVQATWEAETYDELEEKIYPYLDDYLKKKSKKRWNARKLSKKMLETMKNCNNEFTRRAERQGLTKKKVPVKIRYMVRKTKSNVFVRYFMYDKCSKSTTIVLSKRPNGLWKAQSLGH